MTATQLEFVLPPELEARRPPEARDLARDGVRLLVSDRRSGDVHHAAFADIANELAAGDLLVYNDSATLPAALAAHRQDGSLLAVHLSAHVAGTLWIVEPRGAASSGEHLTLPGQQALTLLTPIDPRATRIWYARLDIAEPIVEYLHANGTPIHYSYVDGAYPIEAYQTIFARVPGSAEMPSAGRPFTHRTLQALASRGIGLASITLHCGVASAEVHEPPQPEPFVVPHETAQAVNAARRAERRVVAIGTTVVRALESAVIDGIVSSSQGWTDLVVTEARRLAAVDGVLTGLHEPRASHLAMLSAFLSPEALENAYRSALDARYLWHEFGDLHLIV